MAKSDQPSENQDATSPPKDAEERRLRESRFKRENAEAFASMNAWVEENGLPLEKHRQF